MSNPNFCAGVNILLERMETNPEDFEMHDFNPAQMTEVRGRFYEWGSKLKHIVTGKNKAEVLADFTEWHMLTREEHNALLDGYKAMMRRKMDADILTRLMDTEYVQRQKDAIEEMRQSQTAMYKQAATVRTASAQNSILGAQGAQNSVTLTTSQSNGTSGGILSGIGLGGIF